MAARPVSAAEFDAVLNRDFSTYLMGVRRVAIGVSGGPDSMALAMLLAEWAAARGIEVHALTVDHGLRKESAAEAKQVGKILGGFAFETGTEFTPSPLKSAVLRWAGRKPKTRLMEAARQARYGLMTGYCRENGIQHIFLAHHMDDQAETFLFRLAKGSGLDGLAGMRPAQAYGDVFLLRPLLGFSKQALVDTCKNHKIKFVQDPWNIKETYARPRLRKSVQVLSEEGLTPKRLATTAMRLERARNALDQIAEKSFQRLAKIKGTTRIELDLRGWHKETEDVALRVLIRAIQHLRPDAAYNPRMEKVEALFADLRAPGLFRKRTLGGLLFARDDAKAAIVIKLELKP